MEYITTFLNINAQGYTLLLPITTLGLLLFKSYRIGIFQIIICMNLLMAFCASLSLILFLINIFSFNTEEEFNTLIKRSTGPYWWAYWFLIIGIMLAPLFFFVKKYRKNLVISFIILIALNIERIVIFIASFDRDYLASNWIYYKDPYFEILKYVIYSLIIGLLYYFLNRRRKHNPSINNIT